ncbi:MAG: hypothetical protein NBV76_09850 [Candidatus Ochrobactrum gambitense]|nr:MAG: hypothetical protein NBV76_09850 [Candidatus Ochrobactrum gambitense]WEK16378.1 MAG: hypothetical protein P0Y54_01115 [Candidatus Ochrobactrum gambitense]
MRNTIIISAILFMGFSAASSFAASTTNRANAKGTGIKVMPFCAIGTNPSADGKYYILGTHDECKPINTGNTDIKKKLK